MSLLPVAGRGDSCVWAVPEFRRRLRRSSKDPLPILCSPVRALDLPFTLSLGLLPTVPYTVAGGRCRLLELEGTLPGLVSQRAKLVLSWQAWTGLA